MLHKSRRQTDALMFASVVIVFGLMWVFTDPSLRQMSALLSAVCLGGMLYRCIPYWSVMTSLERVLAGITAWYLIIAAIGSYRLDEINAPASGVIIWAIVLRLVILAAIFFWPFLAGRTGGLRERLARRPPV